MTINVRVSGENSESELRSFYMWLKAEPAVWNNAQISLRRMEPKVGDMGTALDAIQLVTSTTFDIAALAQAYLGFTRIRRSNPEFTFDRDGVVISLQDADPQTIIRLMEALGPGAE